MGVRSRKSADGYLSVEDKASFRRAALSIGIGYIFLQFVIPLVFFGIFFLEFLPHGGGSGVPQPPTVWGMLLILPVYAFFLFAPFALALGMDWTAKKHRDFRAGPGSKIYASLIRRVLARLVDSALHMIPMLCVIGLALWLSADMMKDLTSPIFIMFGLWGVLLFFWLGAMALYAWMESVNGQTPGKRALGIRVVGVDFRPISFGRALIRRVLGVADFQFSGLVAILCVAFSRKFQRVGDMVAETVVLRLP